MINVVTGGSGFVGSNLVTRLLDMGQEVISIDNYSITKGKQPYWNYEHAMLTKYEYELGNLDPNFKLTLKSRIKQKTLRLWHLAANSDIQNSANNPVRDYRDTLGSTVELIDIFKHFNTSQIFFASSSAIYGNHDGKQTSESEISLKPTSNYGIMKLASEQLLINHCESRNTPLWIFRFPNVIGLPLTHGVVHDLFNKLKETPETLQILGDGFQQKPFLHVSNLVDILIEASKLKKDLEILNIGPSDSGITIREVAETLQKKFSPSPRVIYENKKTGWNGDIPIYSLDVSKMRSLFELSNFSSRDSLAKVIAQLVATI